MFYAANPTPNPTTSSAPPAPTLEPTPNPVDPFTTSIISGGTVEPEEPPCGVEECLNDPCDCSELSNCQVCHANGCNQCNQGYFKKDYNFKCEQCQEVFGDDCMHCTDFQGCQQCRTGTRTYDPDCGLYYCA